MENMKEILNKIPDTWQQIKKEEYPLFGVYSNTEIQTLGAYKTPAGNVVTINSYDEKDFIDLYNGQLKEIESVLKGKNWKDFSSINPIKYGYIDYQGCKFYFSCYEVSSSNDVVALQIFVKQKTVVGFLTAIKKPQKFTFEYVHNNEEVVKQIINCIK